MSRLLVHVEGQAEETFVNELLCPHLTRFGWSMVSANDARVRGAALQRFARRSDAESVARISGVSSSRFETCSGALKRSTTHRKRRLPSMWNACSEGTRSHCWVLLPHWKSGSERCGANARTSEAGWIDSSSCQVPGREQLTLLQEACVSSGSFTCHLRTELRSRHRAPSAGSRRRRRTISSRASGALVRNSQCVRLPRQAGRRGGSGSSVSTS